ncbi:MAG TPA: endopeptidase La [Bryobacteraceae bacterium]|jgi:ATP-dependent Lon protease|nr:endopeptidase La [Bryobacteraceae bacterium]
MESPETSPPADVSADVIEDVNPEAAVETGDTPPELPPGLEEISVLAVRDTVLFPNALLPLSVGRPSSVALVESLGENRLIAVVSQIDPRTDVPGPDDLHKTGTVAIIHKIVRMREGQLLFCEGVSRMHVQSFTASEPFLRARIERLAEIEPEMTPELTALRQNVLSEFSQLVSATPNLSDELSTAAGNITEVGRLADFIAGTLPGLSHVERQAVLEQNDARPRLQFINEQLTREVELLELRQKIQSQVQGQLSQSQREFYLREQLKAIQKELGEGDDTDQDAAGLREKIEQAAMPEAVKEEALKELSRFTRINPMSPEHTVARTYLEWLIALPWNVSSGEAVNVQRAAEILDEDHYDLEKVKNRILDFLAVMQLKPRLKGPILCFVGPPGVGKTSLGRSIARSLGRKFQRISLGGMHDEAEIRGHRRTYIGSLPGQIIQAMRRAGANDPVIILDEVDKLGRDFRGDPSSALLEVLDPEQNSTFRDNYLDVAFDLSRTLFITTANMLDTIPDALRDRMEVIELQGYTEQEKVVIAYRYLIPRQKKENGLDDDKPLDFLDDAVRFIVRRYTREAGVRNLEREIGTVCRKMARRYAEGKDPVTEVTVAIVEESLGAPRTRPDMEVAERTSRPGVAVGLAWTPVGGDVLFIEAGRMPGGSKGLIMTGQLGSVMQESVQAALTWVRGNAAKYGIDPDIFKSIDIHVHVPAGATPKDGPSAGVTMATALLSMLTDKCVKANLAMTGEITLTGQVLPIGGIKEKVLAAKRSGVKEIILPAENEVNVKEDLKAEQIGDIKLHYVKTMDDLVPLALQLG